MSDKEKNVVKAEKAKNVAIHEIAPKKKKKVTIGWIFGVIILILISITFVLPTTLFTNTENTIKFGKYDGKDIEFANDYTNYFYQQYANNANTSEYDPNTIQGLYDVFNRSYLTTVYHTALTGLAKDAGIRVPSSVLDKYVVMSGAYAIDETSTFDTDTYKSTDGATKSMIRSQVESTVVDSMIVNDFASVKSSKNEIAFASDMAANGRVFEYALFNAELYPNDLTVQYIKNNPTPFEMVDLQIISFASEEEAIAGMEEIKAGTITFEDAAAKYSQDQLASTGGELGPTYRWALAMNFYDAADADKVFAAAKDEIVGPINAYSGYAIFKVNTALYAADVNDEITLSDAKYYISQNSADEVVQYTKAAADEFYALASEIGFDEAANKMDVVTYPVSSTSQNVGGSTIYPTFSSFDTAGYLATATTDNDTLVKELYSVADNTILSPVEVEGAYIVTTALAYEPNQSMKDYMNIYYNYMAATESQMDNQTAIFNSEKFEDNFTAVFFSDVLGQSTT